MTRSPVEKEFDPTKWSLNFRKQVREWVPQVGREGRRLHQRVLILGLCRSFETVPHKPPTMSVRRVRDLPQPTHLRALRIRNPANPKPREWERKRRATTKKQPQKWPLRLIRQRPPACRE